MNRTFTAPGLIGALFLSLSLQAQLKVNFENSASYRWLNKKVLDSRLLDDMENLAAWKSYTVGADAIVDARATTRAAEAANVAAISLSRDKVFSGSQSLLLRTPTKLEGPAPKNGRSWGRSGIRRVFNGEDWTSFNRISLWIFPDLPGFYTTALDMRLYNDGVQKLPGLFGQEGETSIILRNHEWNHVVWEIGNVARDKITQFEISYGLSGNAPEEADSIQFYFDRLDLERVEPDKIEGWDVWPGRISYSQDGYSSGAPKSAIATELNASSFRLIDQESGETVLSGPVVPDSTHLGAFQLMDFSAIHKPGTYVLEAGDVKTHPFPIGPSVWESSIRKVLNFLYTERCGAAIPGVHGVCHRDWSCVHNDQRIMINGGWHDAGDLTQGLGNTGEIVYALFNLAEHLHSRNENPELYQRVLEEAEWGLDWILKTSFGDGYRNTGSISSRRTNDILGDFDDVTSTARNNPQDNFVAAAAEAIAARVLKESNPRLAAWSLKMAKADWKFGEEGLAGARAHASKEIWTGTFDSDNIEYEVTSIGTLAAVDLWKLTNDSIYEDKAVAWSQDILNSQQRGITDWEHPLAGFFYTSPAKDRLLHFVHRGRQQAHILALTELCKTFPDHPDWMKWYSAITLYSNYIKTIAQATAPYDVLPASIYSDSEYLHVPESRRESFRQQVLNGIPLGKGHYLRLFPVWMDYRGHFGTILPEAQALANAGALRGDLASAQLAEHQLEWIIGRNPFAESMMWGEGYDFAPLYTPSSGDMVGGLPVGIQTRGAQDAPYWPVQSTWTYKEIWVHPPGRWLWLLSSLAGPAIAEGLADGPVTFKDLKTGEETTARPDASTQHFRIALPEGRYSIRSKKEEQNRDFLPGGSYNIDLRPGKSAQFDVKAQTSVKGEVTIRIQVHGTGSHHFTFRTDNLTLSKNQKEITLETGNRGEVELHATVSATDTPWVAVIIPDDDLTQRKELTGTAYPPARLPF